LGRSFKALLKPWLKNDGVKPWRKTIGLLRPCLKYTQKTVLLKPWQAVDGLLKVHVKK
jgi:hypothetical protein